MTFSASATTIRAVASLVWILAATYAAAELGAFKVQQNVVVGPAPPCSITSQALSASVPETCQPWERNWTQAGVQLQPGDILAPKPNEDSRTLWVWRRKLHVQELLLALACIFVPPLGAFAIARRQHT